MTKISLSNIRSLYDAAVRKSVVNLPAFYEAIFQLPAETGVGAEPADTFLDTSGWGKGFVFFNGVNIGHHWPSAGPQVTLYIPGYHLKAPPKTNRLVAFKLEQIPSDMEMVFTDAPKQREPELK